MSKANLKAIKSKHIYLDQDSAPVSGYLLIEDSKISDIIPFSELSADKESLISSYQLFDFTESYIMPGLVDINVHTHSTYQPDWADLENLTKQAIQGGVTTILDNPLLTKYDEKLDEMQAMKERKQSMTNHLYTDCGLLAYLGPHNWKKIETLWSEPHILGFKAYLSHTYQTNLPYFKKEILEKLAGFIKKLSLKDLFISFHPEKATLTDLYLSSPLRSLDLTKRLDLNEDITNSQKFGGGIHGEMDSSDDSNKSDKSEDSEPETTMRDQLRQMIPTSACLKKMAQDNDKLREEQNIHKQEISEYYFNEEEKEIIKNLQTSDSEIEYQNETTSSSEDANKEEKKEPSEQDFPQQPKLIMQSFKPKLTLIRPAPKNHSLNNADKEEISFAKNPLINSIRGALGTLRAVTEPDVNSPDGNPGRDRKISGLLQRRKVANSAIVSSRDSEQLKNFQISIRKNQDTPAKTNATNKIYQNFLYNHSLSWETNGVKTIIKCFRDFNQGNIILSNLSSLSLAFLVREGHKKAQKNLNLSIYCETSIPFLYFYNNMIKKGQCKFKSSPPIRDQETRNLLLEGVKIKGLLDAVSSFHMAVPRALKKIDGGDFKRCFNGLSTIGANLHALWSKLYSKEKIALRKNGDKMLYDNNLAEIFKLIIKLLCENPAKLAFLKGKGKLRKGFDADLVVWSPFETMEFKDKDIHLKEKKGYLFRKQKLYGVVKSTFLRGDEVYKEKEKKFLKKGVVLLKNDVKSS